MNTTSSSTSSSRQDQQAKNLCLRLLTARDRTRVELDERLTSRGYPREVRQRVLDRLTEVGLIDDARFAQQWVQSRLARTAKSRSALAAELQNKGLNADLIDQAVSVVTPNVERVQAEELIRKQLRHACLDDVVKLTRRLVGMLARRGYGANIAYEVVRQEIHEEQLRRTV